MLTTKAFEMKKQSYYLLFIILLGTVLRIYGLDSENLWFDEVGSVNLALRNIGTVFFKFHNSPLYFLLLKCWIKMWGVSEFALRSLSVIFGVCSILLIYKLAKKLFNKNVGLFSAFLLSISPIHIFYSQEARNYSLLIFLTLLSMLSFVNLLNKEQCKSYFYLTLINILVVYTLLHGILVVLVQNVFYFFKGKHKKRWLMYQAVVLLFFLLWFIPINIVAHTEPWIKVSTSWIEKPHFSALLETFKTFSYGDRSYGGKDIHIETKDLRMPQILFFIYTILFLLGLLQGKLWNNRIEYKQRAQTIVLLNVWLFLSILVPFLFSIVFFPLYVIRYVIFALPAFLIIIAIGISKISNRIAQITVIFIISIFTAFSISVYYTEELKITWRDAINYIEKNKNENDVIIVSLAKEVRLFGYYGKNGLRNRQNGGLNIDKQLGSKLVTGGFVYNEAGNELIGVNDADQLKEIMNSVHTIKKRSNIWLLISRWAVGDKKAGSIKDYLDKRYQCKQEKAFSGITIYYYISNKFEESKEIIKDNNFDDLVESVTKM